VILGDIIKGVYSDPKDNITPLKNIRNIVSSVLGIILFAGPVATAVGEINEGLGFALAHTTPPAPVDKFVACSNVASSMEDVVRYFQATVSKSINAILNAEIDNPTNGISKF
jgi:hypothetical protein